MKAQAERNIFERRARDERVDAIVAQVQVDLLEHMRDFQKHAPHYIREYAKAVVGPKTTRNPHAHMHTKLAGLIRELALDAATMERRVPSYSSVDSSTRDNRPSP